ncbi:histidine phosphatase family protein [Camelimonas abortus]|uniref:Histidine phosphatase family protein n=1 Tax=Camelimonas abortus TaxID=1017184 RepID=A0ABV7LDW3_9HYPH
MERRIFLVRHAPVMGPAGVIHGSGAPADVSDAALAAATRAALLRAAPAATAWCSPALRTRQTAAALGLAATPDPRISEQDFGAWTGRRHADLAVELGEAYAAFWRDAAHNAPPGGESFASQQKRVAAFLAGLPPGDHVAVTHSGAIRAAVATAFGLDLNAALSLVIDPLSVTLLELLPGGWRVGYVNRLALWR